MKWLSISLYTEFFLYTWLTIITMEKLLDIFFHYKITKQISRKLLYSHKIRFFSGPVFIKIHFKWGLKKVCKRNCFYNFLISLKIRRKIFEINWKIQCWIWWVASVWIFLLFRCPWDSMQGNFGWDCVVVWERNESIFSAFLNTSAIEWQIL